MRRFTYCTTLLLAASATALIAAPTTAPAPSATQSTTTTPAKKITVAVLPFVGSEAKEQALAEKMRFAISQKISSVSADGTSALESGGVGKKYDRLDNILIDKSIFALQIPWSSRGPLPDEDDILKTITTLEVDQAFVGKITGRKLSVTLYQDAKPVMTAHAEIPGERESPKLAVEALITKLTGTKFEHLREWEVDHADPQKEARFAKRANLVADSDFEDASKNESKTAPAWGTLLLADRYAPPLRTLDEAPSLSQDRVAIVPQSLANDPAAKDGHCLMMRMSKNVAENNGLACESTWIPVEHGATYRFTVKYRSTGPVPRLFLKGFATKADEFGDKKDPEATRREFYRAQILARAKNDKFELIEMDFTPSVVQAGKGAGGSKAEGMKIEWLRIDLYIYLSPGDVFFDEVVLKKISE